MLPVTVHDGEMADLLVAHQPGGIEDGGADIDGERRPGHHIADPHGVQVGRVARQGEHVTLGEDADEPAHVANRNGADSLFEHAQNSQPSGVVGVHRDHSRPHDVTDRHAWRV